VTTVIGLGTVADFVARGAAGFFLAAPSPVARRAAGTGVTAFGSSGTGARSGVFGGEARRGKAGDP